ncbi:hypothetical protein [Streptomyces sp. NPDC002845]
MPYAADSHPTRRRRVPHARLALVIEGTRDSVLAYEKDPDNITAVHGGTVELTGNDQQSYGTGRQLRATPKGFAARHANRVTGRTVPCKAGGPAETPGTARAFTRRGGAWN